MSLLQMIWITVVLGLVIVGLLIASVRSDKRAISALVLKAHELFGDTHDLVARGEFLLKLWAHREGRFLTAEAQERLGQELRDCTFGIADGNGEEVVVRIAAVADEIHPPLGVELPIIGEVESDDHE